MKLPEQLYITMAGEKDDQYFLAYERPEDMAENAALVDVGIYELKSRARIRTSVEVLEQPVYKSKIEVKKK